MQYGNRKFKFPSNNGPVVNKSLMTENEIDLQENEILPESVDLKSKDVQFLSLNIY